MNSEELLFDLGIESGKSLTQYFIEKFWMLGKCPVTKTMRIVTDYEGKMTVKAKTLEIDGKLLDRMTIWDLQAVVDGIGG